MTGAKLDLCSTLALTFYPLPSVFIAFRRDRAEAKGEGGQERKWQLAGFDCEDERPVNPDARIFMETANDSPSPWGEGRDEGGREPKMDRSRRNQMKAEGNHVRCVTASGGVTCNRALRRELARACEREGFVLQLAEKSLCTDNAAMIGILAERKLLANVAPTSLDEEINPGWVLA
jgi:tRNA N6-adenosine threonylcarbamoyltransferase